MDTIKTISDTLISNGFLGLQSANSWINYSVYIAVGLFFTWFYFWQNFKKDPSFPNNWKEVFSVDKYRKIFFTHIIFYGIIILAWILEGGKILVYVPIEITRWVLGFVGFTFGAADSVYQAFDTIMPKGQLTLFTAFWGFFGTSIVKNWIPNILHWLKSKFNKDV